MREFKILAVVIVLTLITYWGVEPFAHSQMHPHVSPANFNFAEADKESAKEGVEKAEKALVEAEKAGNEKAIHTAKTDLDAKTTFEKDINEFWASNEESIKAVGDVANGETLVTTNCTACHSIESKGFPKVMDNATAASAYGVTPPDLSAVGKLYSKEYLVGFVKNPVKASKVEHKFVDGKVHPMPGYDWMSAQEIADIVAYLQSIAPKEMTNKEVFHDACQRCHSIKYADMKGGSMTAFTPNADIKTYMGKLPPDLSQYIRSRGHEYLDTFINDPQKQLEGTSMPRVGLTEESQKQVISYLEEVGDSKKLQREELGPKFLIYLVVFAIFAFLWKASKWRDVH
ncbi:c-type cytochrome [Arcobacter lacus]|jgi:ubiquinol-cytochrome c reductase cytochrome c1 subunit|uniref:c-type cytochrome n=1 Tax=Arcobacter lacus TaxID=1912876 RepID=UPI0021BB2C10|nr:c-type cytochrome [Arcobacter lacus]MCT7909357.1 c-type cytochrome [Arcobacter lacus]MCT7911010.1 c-type cytochrome [Arcobacter lacus]